MPTDSIAVPIRGLKNHRLQKHPNTQVETGTTHPYQLNGTEIIVNMGTECVSPQIAYQSGEWRRERTTEVTRTSGNQEQKERVQTGAETPRTSK